MVLLSKVTEEQIVENLRKRYINIDIYKKIIFMLMLPILL